MALRPRVACALAAIVLCPSRAWADLAHGCGVGALPDCTANVTQFTVHRATVAPGGSAQMLITVAQATLVAVKANQYAAGERVASTGLTASEWAGLGRSTPTSDASGRNPRALNGDLCVVPNGEEPVAHGYTSDAGHAYSGLRGCPALRAP